ALNPIRTLSFLVVALDGLGGARGSRRRLLRAWQWSAQLFRVGSLRVGSETSFKRRSRHIGSTGCVTGCATPFGCCQRSHFARAAIRLVRLSSIQRSLGASWPLRCICCAVSKRAGQEA